MYGIRGSTSFKWKQKEPGHYVPYRKWETELLGARNRIDWALVYALAVAVTIFAFVGITVFGGVVL